MHTRFFAFSSKLSWAFWARITETVMTDRERIKKRAVLIKFLKNVIDDASREVSFYITTNKKNIFGAKIRSASFGSKEYMN